MLSHFEQSEKHEAHSNWNAFYEAKACIDDPGLLKLNVLVVSEPSVEQGTNRAEHESEQCNNPFVENVVEKIEFFRIHSFNIFSLHGSKSREETDVNEKDDLREVVLKDLQEGFLGTQITFRRALWACDFLDLGLYEGLEQRDLIAHFMELINSWVTFSWHNLFEEVDSNYAQS